MYPVAPNEWGITHIDGISDMDDAGPLDYQLEQKGRPYEKTSLPMGTLFAEPAYILSYRTKDGTPVSVLVLPLRGPDSWAEEYYSMVGVDHATALSKPWRDIIDDVRALWRARL